jgi:hypothetical protein
MEKIRGQIILQKLIVKLGLNKPQYSLHITKRFGEKVASEEWLHVLSR